MKVPPEVINEAMRRFPVPTDPAKAFHAGREAGAFISGAEFALSLKEEQMQMQEDRRG